MNVHLALLVATVQKQVHKLQLENVMLVSFAMDHQLHQDPPTVLQEKCAQQEDIVKSVHQNRKLVRVVSTTPIQEERPFSIVPCVLQVTIVKDKLSILYQALVLMVGIVELVQLSIHNTQLIQVTMQFQEIQNRLNASKEHINIFITRVHALIAQLASTAQVLAQLMTILHVPLVTGVQKELITQQHVLLVHTTPQRTQLRSLTVSIAPLENTVIRKEHQPLEETVIQDISVSRSQKVVALFNSTRIIPTIVT